MTPEHVERARESVLGCLLHFYVPESIIVVQAQGVTPRDFGTPDSRPFVLYRAILALHKAGSMVDPLTVEGFLARHGMLDRAGGPAYMEYLACGVALSSLKEHAALVAEEGRWMRHLRACEAAMAAAHARDAVAFWEAVGRIKPDLLPEPLRVIEGGRVA